MNFLFKMDRMTLLSCAVLLLGAALQAQEPAPTPPRYIETFSRPPDPQRVFRLESYQMLKERMARESRQGIDPLDLKYEYTEPEYPPPPPPAPVVREWQPMTAIAEPAYVCHNRLFFQQLNAERYGWSFGAVHPLVSVGEFYLDLVTLPYHAAQKPHGCYDTSLGYALPGDPMPLLLYTPKPSLSGALTEVAIIGLLFVAFP